MPQPPYTLNNGETFTETELRHYFARWREWAFKVRNLLDEQGKFIKANSARLEYDISRRPPADEVAADEETIYEDYSYLIGQVIAEQPALATVQAELEVPDETT